MVSWPDFVLLSQFHRDVERNCDIYGDLNFAIFFELLCNLNIYPGISIFFYISPYPILGWVPRDEYQVLGSTAIPTRLDTLVYWEPFSWLTSVSTTRNTVIRLGWSRIGLAVLILHAAGVGLTDRPAVISGRYNKYHSLQLHNYYAHVPPLQHTHIHAKHNYAELVMGMIMGFEALHAGRGRRNPVWSGKEAHWSLRGLIVKSAEHCGADYKPLDI